MVIVVEKKEREGWGELKQQLGENTKVKISETKYKNSKLITIRDIDPFATREEVATAIAEVVGIDPSECGKEGDYALPLGETRPLLLI